MQIAPINEGYNDRGTWKPVPRSRLRPRKARPFEAVTFDNVDLSGDKGDKGREYDWLATYVRALPDSTVKARMKETLDSYDTIDEALVDKLIMEAL